MDAISEEVKLLVGNHIDTAEQLSSYKEGLELSLIHIWLVKEVMEIGEKQRGRSAECR